MADLPDPSQLYIHRWECPDPQGRILMLHGKGDYGDGFQELASRLLPAGWSCYAPDMWGFGRSQGIRGKVRRFATLLKDLEVLEQQLDPVIWIGYSTGAVWAVDYALQHPERIQGLILISPAFRIDHYFNRFTRQLLPVLNWLIPQWPVTRRYNFKKQTSIPEIQARYASDPYITGETRIRFVAELVQRGRWCIQQAAQLSMPILVLYSPQDQVIDPAGVLEFVRAAKMGSVQVKAFANSRHDLLHDVEAAAVEVSIMQWVAQLGNK